MIRGMHGMFYSSEPEALRAFFRDKLVFSANDIGGGWLIFDLPEADMGVHPTETRDGQPSGTPSISFYCDDIAVTRAELESLGVEFVDAIHDAGFGLVTNFRAPGGFAIQLYQPRYAKRPASG